MHHLAALRALALPFHAAPLLLVAVFSPLLLLGVRGGLLGLLVLLIVGSWFFKYAFLLLDHAADGRPGAPVLTPEDVNPLGEMRPLAYGLLAAVFYAASGTLGDWLGPGLVSAVRLLGLASLPALLATNVVTGSFLQALNPLALVEMTRRLGPGYLLIMLVAAACWWLGSAIVMDGAQLTLLLRIALLMLLWLALFSLVGGVLYERRLEVGFEAEHSPERRRGREDANRDRSRDRFIDQVFAEFRSGAHQNALQSIRLRATGSPWPVDEYAWIHERVSAWPSARLANAVARELLPLLLASGRNGEALGVARIRLKADAKFRPASGEQALRLAELARAAGDRPLARALLEEFEAQYPDDADRIRARRLAEELGSPR